jgi:GNAT superfamily N-acetyltransferase
MASWTSGMKKRRNLPDTVDLRPRLKQHLESGPERIRDVVAKGQGKQPCCVAFTHMMDRILIGTWGNGSVRFLHCVCKMLDSGMPSISMGTTMLTGIRAEKGWWTCEEEFWPSDISLSISQFEDWKSIPQHAWEDARKKRVRKNRVFAASRSGVVVEVGGESHQLVTNYETDVFEKDKQIDFLVMDEDFDTIAWAQVRSYIDQRKVVLEDLFVKPEKRRMGLGSELLSRIEYVTCSDKTFREASNEITVPIPSVDIWLPIRNLALREFWAKNGYRWQNTKIVPGREYSVFTASKKLSCGEIPKRADSTRSRFRGQLVRTLRYITGNVKRVEGPCIVHVRVFNTDYMDVWRSIDRP